MTDTPQTGTRSALPFVIALFAAPAALAAIAGIFFQLGDYGSRFGLAGTLGLIAVLPAWFTAYAWLAWRDTLQGPPGMKPRVKASLAANFASLLIFPALIVLSVWAGGYEALFASENTAVIVDGVEGALPEAPSPRDAGIASATVAFLLGLVFMPLLAAIFSWVERKVG
jgi:hypothetical protein